MNPFRNPMRPQKESNQDPTKSIAADESDPNFKKIRADPCPSVSHSVAMSRSYDEGLTADGAVVDRVRSSIAMGHGLHG